MYQEASLTAGNASLTDDGDGMKWSGKDRLTTEQAQSYCVCQANRIAVADVSRELQVEACRFTFVCSEVPGDHVSYVKRER